MADVKNNKPFLILAQFHLHESNLLKLGEYIDTRVVFDLVLVWSCGGYWGRY
jgi:hypothetical protein